MPFVSHISDPNIMNDSQLFTLKENYANMIIDGMDMDSLCQMAFDLLLDAYQDLNEEELKAEILDLYDEEMLESLMPIEWKSVGNSKGGRRKCPCSIGSKQPQERNQMSQQLSATIYRNLFTDSEWDAISSALKDYADYGDEEATIADSIDSKITSIFRLTEAQWELHLLRL